MAHRIIFRNGRHVVLSREGACVAACEDFAAANELLRRLDGAGVSEALFANNKSGKIPTTIEDIRRGSIARAQARSGRNVPTWVANEQLWLISKEAAARQVANTSDEFYPLAAAIYRTTEAANEGTTEGALKGWETKRANFEKQVKRSGVIEHDEDGDETTRVLPSDAKEGKFDVWHSKGGVRNLVSDPANPLDLPQAHTHAVEHALKKTSQPEQMPIAGQPAAVATPPPAAKSKGMSVEEGKAYLAEQAKKGVFGLTWNQLEKKLGGKIRVTKANEDAAPAAAAVPAAFPTGSGSAREVEAHFSQPLRGQSGAYWQRLRKKKGAK